MKSYTIQEYQKAECPEIQVTDMIGLALYHFTEGKLCTSGCNRFKGGNCKHYYTMTGAKLTNKNNIKPPLIVIDDPLPPTPLERTHMSETVREEAKRRGISIKQVRRERHEEIV
jgi:hypothetical protein